MTVIYRKMKYTKDQRSIEGLIFVKRETRVFTGKTENKGRR